MTVLFVMDSPEYLRFYDSVVEELAARGHAVTIAVNSSRERKPVGLDGLAAHAGHATVLGVVPRLGGLWGDVALVIRATTDFVRFLHPRFAGATALRARIRRKVLPRAFHGLDAIGRLPAWAVRLSVKALAVLERTIPVCQPIADLLRRLSPDVLLVSPLVGAASEQVDWIKAAHVAGVRSAVAIASWDNLTNKGLLRIEPDLVLLWNDAQRREASEFHYVPEHKVAVTGAQVFDRWFAGSVRRERADFCAHVGLPDAGPFVLFTGSSGFISESSVEVAFVRRWIAALRTSDDPAVRSVHVLVRPHPYNAREWEREPLADCAGVSVFPRRGYNPIDADTRADFFDSLSHAAAVVGVNTSAMVEAAILGRPVLTILADEFALTQEGTIHFHHLLPAQGGFLRLARTLDEHVGQLAEDLRDPERARARTKTFVGSFVRPHGIDRPATPAFADALEALASRPAPRPRSAAPFAVLRPVVLLVALPALVVDWLVSPGGPRAWTHGAAVVVHRLRKRARRRAIASRDRVRRVVKGAARWWHRSIYRWQKSSRAR